MFLPLWRSQTSGKRDTIDKSKIRQARGDPAMEENKVGVVGHRTYLDRGLRVSCEVGGQAEPHRAQHAACVGDSWSYTPEPSNPSPAPGFPIQGFPEDQSLL